VSKTVAVIGASTDRRKFGNKALRAYRARGFDVLPINPRVSMVEGLPAYASVRDAPRRPDLALVYVPPAIGVGVLDDLAAVGVGQVYLNPGADAPMVVERARALGLNVIRGCAIVAIGESPSAW
jgi:predicted CoA-binding protein